MSTYPCHRMKQKDYCSGLCRQKAAQSAVALTCIAKRYTRRRCRRSVFSSNNTLSIVAATYAESQQQVHFLTDKASRIVATDFLFSFNRFSDKEGLTLFRFRIDDITTLFPILSWPCAQTHTTRNRYGVSPILATCILLRRMAVPDRWEDINYMFGKHPSQMSEIFWEGLDKFLAARGHLLLSPVPQSYMQDRATGFSKAINDKGAALDKYIGFIDGTVVGVAQPKGYMQQMVLYNGHKRKHALKYQAINTPDGMILHAHRPVEGRRHDWYLYHCSGIESNLTEILLIDGVQYVVFGDSGYNWRCFMEVPFQGSNLNSSQTAFNTSMSKVRITAEWIFKEVKMYFPVVDTKRKLKLWESPIGLLYLATMLMCNMRHCMYPNQISAYFGVSPPSLAEYVSDRAAEFLEE